MSKRWIPALVLFLISGSAANVFACTCLDGGPPCQRFGVTDAVFLGRVTQITEFEEDAGEIFGEKYRQAFLRVRFQVEQGFRGVQAREVEVVTSASGSSCGYGFQRNARYVVYAHRSQSDGRLSTGLCSGTKPVAAAAADLEYFQARDAMPPGGRVFGAIEKAEKDPLRFEQKSLGPAVRVPIIVRSGDKSWETLTDNRGRYEFSGLLPGAYEVQLLLPGNLTSMNLTGLGVSDRNLRVDDRGCAKADFVVLAERRIRGRLLDARGQPVADQAVQLLPEAKSSLDRELFVYPQAVSVPDGTFEFKELPPGRYYVGIGLHRPPFVLTPRSPIYPMTYYPGVLERSAAVVVDVTDGSQEGIDIRLPSPLAPREIRGVVRWSDGRPAAGASVSLLNPQYNSSQAVTTGQADKTGLFVLEGYQETPYSLVARTFRTPENPVPAAESKPATVDGGFTEIVLPFPGRVAGRVVDSRGTVAGVEVELIPVDAQVWRDSFLRFPTQRSRDDGRYMFEGVRPGRYFVAIHFSTPPRSGNNNDSDYPRFFYPNAIDRRSASVVEVAEAGTVELTDFRLPAPLIPQKVEGTVVWNDGNPVQDGEFFVEDSEFPGWSHVVSGPVGKDGRFSASLFQGRRYVIFATTSTGDDGNPLLLLRQTGPVEVLVTGKPDPIKLTIPAP